MGALKQQTELIYRHARSLPLYAVFLFRVIGRRGFCQGVGLLVPVARRTTDTLSGVNSVLEEKV